MACSSRTWFSYVGLGVKWAASDRIKAMALSKEVDEVKGSERELGARQEWVKAIITGFESEFYLKKFFFLTSQNEFWDCDAGSGWHGDIGIFVRKLSRGCFAWAHQLVRWGRFYLISVVVWASAWPESFRTFLPPEGAFWDQSRGQSKAQELQLTL